MENILIAAELVRARLIVEASSLSHSTVVSCLHLQQRPAWTSICFSKGVMVYIHLYRDDKERLEN